MDWAATDWAAVDRAAMDGAVMHEAVVDRAAVDRAAVDRAVVDRAATDRAATDRAVMDRAVCREGRVPDAEDSAGPRRAHVAGRAALRVTPCRVTRRGLPGDRGLDAYGLREST